MVLDGEAVRLLLNAANQREQRGRLLNANLLPRRSDQRTGAVPVVLYHAEGRNIQSQLCQHLFGYARMGHAAVNEQYVRSLVEARVAVLQVRQAAGQRLPHGRIVILPVQAAHFEALIVALQRLPPLEHHHGGDNLGPGGVGNVVGLHPQRRLRQPQQLLQLQEGAGSPALPAW